MLKALGAQSSVTGQLSYQGTWNASTNNPTLTSSVGVANQYYVVSTAGSTNLNGITSWSVGDWAIFNGTAWQKVLGGTTESFANLTVTGLTGYMYANGTSQVTAATTIPVASVTGAVPNTVNVIAGTGLSGGGALTGNVTITNAGVTAFNTRTGNVTLSNTDVITALGYTPGTGNGTVSSITAGTGLTGGTITTSGTIALANTAVTAGTYGSNTTVAQITIDAQGRITAASNVTITGGGGNAAPSPYNNYVATANISVSANIGAFSYGTLTYSDVNIVASYANSVNNYSQIIFQNASAGGNASVDFIVSNNLGTASNYYGDFGINSSNFNATPGSIGLPNATYLYSQGGDLVIGSASANAVHFLANSSVTDSFVVNSNNLSFFYGQAKNLVTITAGNTIGWTNTAVVLIAWTNNVAANVVWTSSTYTAKISDYTILSNASVLSSIQLPTAVGVLGQEYVIKKTDTSGTALTVSTTSSQTIDGATTYSLPAQYNGVKVQSDNANWWITGTWTL